MKPKKPSLTFDGAIQCLGAIQYLERLLELVHAETKFWREFIARWTVCGA